MLISSLRITSILISRFILNLRDVADGHSDDLTEPSFVRHSRAGATSTVNFAEFIDPMGGDLVHGTTSTRSTAQWSNDADVSEENEMESFTATRTYTGSGLLRKSVEIAEANASSL